MGMGKHNEIANVVTMNDIFRRRTDSLMPAKEPGFRAGPLLKAMKEAVGKRRMPAILTKVMEEGKQGIVPATAKTVRAALWKEAEVTQTLIRLLAGETPLGVPEAYRYYFGAMVDPEKLRTFRSAKDRVLLGHIRAERAGGKIKLKTESTIIEPGQDAEITNALNGNRILYYANGRLFSVDRKDIWARVEKERMPSGPLQSRLIIPLDDHFGLVEVTGNDLTFGSLLGRHEGAVTAALDFSKILSLKYAAELDGLTGLYNRRAFNYLLTYFCEEFVKGGNDLSLVMLDVDHFKRVNDNYGHLTGDQVLAMCAATASATMRSSDLLGRISQYPTDAQDEMKNGREIARYGGEEFALLLPGVGNMGASAAARRCKDAVCSRIVEGPNGEIISVTISMGIASLSEAEKMVEASGGADGPADKADRMMKAIIAMADAALYRAKELGRNGIVISAFDRERSGERDDGIVFTKL